MHLRNRGISNINTVRVEKPGHQRVKGLHLMKKKVTKENFEFNEHECS